MLGLIVAGTMLLTLAIGSVVVLPPRCDRPVGDETDFPLFFAIGEAVCGARAVVDGG